MVDFTRWLLDNGYSVRLFSSQARSDGRVAVDLMDAIGEASRPGSLQSALGSIHDVSDLVREITACDVIVAGRYHSVLLPLLLDIPVLGLAYNPKTAELLTDAGHPERCLGIDAFDVETLVQAFQDVSGAEDAHVREGRRSKIAAHRAAVDEQFDRVFGTVRGAEEERVNAEVRAP
jgi:polysaccharide pyruvyl transferase WcaK-like protein